MSDTIERTVHFDLFAPEAMLTARGCPHSAISPRTNADHCLACSITAQVAAAIKSGDLSMSGQERVLHSEFEVVGRRWQGTYSTDVGRLAVQRMIAWLHGHPDPLTLITDGCASD